MDALVTFSDEEEIFGKRTIRISNGVDFDSIPLHVPSVANTEPINLIGVAEVHLWHGFDRVMTGLGEYFQKYGRSNIKQRDVHFHVVGGVHPNQMSNCFAPIIEKYHLKDKIIIKFGVNKEWMFAIAYYRGWFDKYKDYYDYNKIFDFL